MRLHDYYELLESAISLCNVINMADDIEQATRLTLRYILVASSLPDSTSLLWETSSYYVVDYQGMISLVRSA